MFTVIIASIVGILHACHIDVKEVAPSLTLHMSLASLFFSFLSQGWFRNFPQRLRGHNSDICGYRQCAGNITHASVSLRPLYYAHVRHTQTQTLPSLFLVSPASNSARLSPTYCPSAPRPPSHPPLALLRIQPALWCIYNELSEISHCTRRNERIAANFFSYRYSK